MRGITVNGLWIWGHMTIEVKIVQEEIQIPDIDNHLACNRIFQHF